MCWRVLEAERGELRELPKVIPWGKRRPPAGTAAPGSQLEFRKLLASPPPPVDGAVGQKMPENAPLQLCPPFLPPLHIPLQPSCWHLPAPLPGRGARSCAGIHGAARGFTGCGAEGRGC